MFKRILSKVRTQILLVTLVLLVIPGLIIGITSYRVASNELESSGKKQLQNSVRLAIEIMDKLNDQVVRGFLSLEETQEAFKSALLGKKQPDGTRPINNRINLGKDGYFMIFNEQGILLAHPSLEGDNVWDVESEGFYLVQDQINKALKGGGFTKYKWLLPYSQDLKENKLTYSEYYPQWGWIITAGTYMSSFNRGANNILYILLLTIVICLFIGVIIAVLWSTKLSRDIVNTASYADMIARGRLDIHPLLKNRNDEVGILIESINNMKNELNAGYQQMEAYNEEVVALNSDLEEQKEKLRLNYEKLEADNEEIMALNEELEESYNEVNRLNINLHKMINLTARLGIKGTGENEFLKELFQTAISLVKKVENGILFKVTKEYLKILDTLNYDYSIIDEYLLINKIDIPVSENVVSIEGFYNQFILPLINEDLDFGKDKKRTYIINLSDLNKKDFVGITLDIPLDNKLSNSSLEVLSVFQTLARVFYRLERYNTLQNKTKMQIIISIVKMLDIHDEYTKNHSQNVAEIASKIAKNMGLDEEYIEKIYLAGVVHDIGKVLIPTEILNKKGLLTNEEFELIKKHPYWGYETLQSSSELNDIAKFVLHHHERWDGKGYPTGIAQDDIPLASQILSVADSWDAMISDRSYRMAMSEEKAIKELIKNRGTQFSPKVVDAFLSLESSY